MAKTKYSPNDIQSINEDWGQDVNDSLKRGFSGAAVQKFIKAQLNSKVGKLYYDAKNSIYLCFASKETCDEYLADNTKTDLIIGRFDAPFNYTAKIELLSNISNIIFTTDKNNVIKFNFDIVNKSGNSTGEGVTCVYTIAKGLDKKVYTEKYTSGTTVIKNVDDWLTEGTTTINIAITGNESLASTTMTVTYQVINLSIVSDYNPSQVADLTKGNTIIEIPYTVSGYGIKYVEWYIDGVKKDFIKDEDEITEASSTRTKYIDCTGMSQGVHSIQYRVYTVANGEKIYSDIHYVEAIVYDGTSTKSILALSCIIPRDKHIVDNENPLKFYNIEQFVPYNVTFGTYSPKNLAKLNVTIKLDDQVYSTVDSTNNKKNVTSFLVYNNKVKDVKFITDDATRVIPLEIKDSNISISEITNGLDFNFDAKGKSNTSSDRDVYKYGNYTGTLTGFNWNATSGWVDNVLKLNAGNKIAFDITPLKEDAMKTGKTFEFSIKSTSVFDDDVVLCNLTTDGAGIKITASNIIVTTEAGKTIKVSYNSEEFVKFDVVINRREGSTNKGLLFIYANGILSAAINVIASDYIRSNEQLTFAATDKAKLDIKQIRIYNVPLNSDQVLNNYILYQDSTSDMTKLYNKNNILSSDGTTFDTEKLAAQCPVMIITGDIPVLENTSNKKEQIIVDVNYINMQDPTKSFTMKGAAMRPQGTSSMSYPKKNFRLYTNKVDDTEVYDYQGNKIEDKLYAFKDNAQPVDVWCLKADYAESSGTHNTGIARLWNKVMYDAVIDGEHKLRTKAQVTALSNNYKYDVRTTVDGFPINLFYKLNYDSELVFIGKYNFNNDKSTESVYGFRDIPGFDNSKVECWEVLNNGDPIALFKTVNNFDKAWSTAFEGRYPDGNTEVTNLKAFCTWVSRNNGKVTAFKRDKWEHLDVYKVAAYYVYLMRFGAVDQPVKNAMITTEDGQHYFFINYDNDTINGEINTGNLEAPWDVDRNTKGVDGAYIYAGHESVLWNMLEQDDEFMNIVQKVDIALYIAGLKYADVIDMFDNKQAGAWSQRVYNYDATYKYLNPYTRNGVNNLFMLQGSRSTHRKFWLQRRFNLYDSKFVSGAFKSNVFEIKFINDTPANQSFTITAANKLYYGYGINELVTESGIKLLNGESHTFSTPRVLNLGDPVRIYGVTELDTIDVSACANRINQLSVSSNTNCNNFTKLICGSTTNNNEVVSEISGIKKLVNLKTLDLTNYRGFTSLDLTGLYSIETLKINGTNISNVEFDEGSQISTIEFSQKFNALNFHNLPNLTIAGLKYLNYENIASINITDCPNITTSKDIVNSWLQYHTSFTNKNNIILDNINWKCTAAEIIKLGEIKTAGGTLSLKGKITLDSVTEEQVNKIVEIYGSNCFSSDNELWIVAPSSIYVSGPTTVKEDGSYVYTPVVFSQKEGTLRVAKSGLTSADSYNDETNTLTCNESGYNRTITLTFMFTSNDGSEVNRKDITIKVQALVYARSFSISEVDISSTSKKYIVTPNGTYDRAKITDITINDAMSAIGSIGETNLDEHYIIYNYTAPLEIVNGVITVQFKTDFTLSSNTTFKVELVNENIVLTSKNNRELITSLFNNGIIANKDYITKAECGILTKDNFSSTNNLYIENQRDANFFSYLTITDLKMYNLHLANNITINVDTLNLTITNLYINRGNINININSLKVDYLNKEDNDVDNYYFNSTTNSLILYQILLEKDTCKLTTKTFNGRDFREYKNVYTIIVDRNTYPICNYLPNTSYNKWEIVQDDNFHAQLITDSFYKSLYVCMKSTDNIANKVVRGNMYYTFYEKLIKFVNKVKTDKNLKSVNIYWYNDNISLILDKDNYDSIIRIYGNNNVNFINRNDENVKPTINKEFAYLNAEVKEINITTENKSNEFYYLPNYYKREDFSLTGGVLYIDGNKSIVVANNFTSIYSNTDAIIDKLKMDFSYDVSFQIDNIIYTGIINKYLQPHCAIKELYMYCSTATVENKLKFEYSVTPNDIFKNNCTKVYLPVQDVVDVESVANLHLPDTVEVIYSIPVGATCYTDLPIKYDL